MLLHILRHAKTNQFSRTGKDFDRELLEKGVIQCEKLREKLCDLILTPIEIHCSSSKRTTQTYSLIESGIKNKSISYNKELYLASNKNYLNYVNSLDTIQDILLIGHNDGLSELVSYLTDEDYHLKTCSFVTLEVNIDSWSELSKGLASIKQEYRPIVHL